MSTRQACNGRESAKWEFRNLKTVFVGWEKGGPLAWQAWDESLRALTM